MSVTIREIQKSDNAGIAKMIRDVFIEYKAPREGTVFVDPTTDDLFSVFTAPNSVLWVAEQDGEIVGACGVYPTENLPDKCIELVKFYVSSKVRGTGVGRDLMIKSEQSAIEFGYNQIYIESLPAFNNAVRIYAKHGYKTLAKPLGDSGHFGCDIWMVKDLKSETN